MTFIVKEYKIIMVYFNRIRGENLMKKLLSLIKGKYLFMSILTPLLIIGEVLMETTIPRIMGKIVDVGIQNSDIQYVIKCGLLMIVMSILSLSFGAGAGRTVSIASMGFAAEVRKKMFNKIQDFSFSNVDKFSTSSLVTRMTTDITNLQNAFMMAIRSMFRAPIMLISAFFMAFSLNKKLSVIFLVAVPVLAFFLVLIMTNAHPRFQKMLKKYDKLNLRVQENLIAIRVVKAFVRGDFEKEEFSKTAEEAMNAQMNAEKLVIINMPLMQMIVYISTILVLWFGGNFIIGGTMDTGELISFITYTTQILFSLMMISMSLMMIVISKASIKRIVEVLNEEPSIPDNGDENNFVKDGSVVFENVSFSYKGEKENYTLSNINLEIKSGETVGIIGGTGSAKSTLVHLIPRFYDVTDGVLKVGGIDVRDYKQNVLRNAVSLVLQKNVLFSGSIKENLLWGDKNATDEDIKNACVSAQADDFIKSFPDGYESLLTQGGSNVSGGQKQRLCIARALLKKPKILILDDSTSAVDTATDSKIREAFKNELSDTTKIIIAQRISSVCDADKIVVLDNGEINAVGTHEELMKNNEIYREVYESQQKGVA